MIALRRLFIIVLLAISLPAIAQRAALIGPVSDPRYKTRVQNVIHALRINEVLLEGIRRSVRQRLADQPAALQDALQRLNQPDLHKRFEEMTLPYYADFIPSRAAEPLDLFFVSSAGVKMAEMMYQSFIDPKRQIDFKKFTADEQRLVNWISRYPDAQKALQDIRTFNPPPEFKQDLFAFFEGEKIFPPRPNNAQLADTLQRYLDDPDGAEIQVGSSSAPEVRLIAAMLQRAQQINQQYSDSVSRLGIDNVLTPKVLSSGPAITEYLQKVSDMQKALEQRRTAVAAHIEQSAAESRQFASTMHAASRKKFTEGFEERLAEGYVSDLAFAENQQKLLGLYQKILRLAEANTGKIHFDTDRDVLVFADNDALAAYNNLLGQVTQEALNEQKIRSDKNDRIQNVLQKLRQ